MCIVLSSSSIALPPGLIPPPEPQPHVEVPARAPVAAQSGTAFLGIRPRVENGAGPRIDPLAGTGVALVLLAHGIALWAVLHAWSAPALPAEGAPRLAEFVLISVAPPVPAAPSNTSVPEAPAPPRVAASPRPVAPPAPVLATPAPAESAVPDFRVTVSAAPASAALASTIADVSARSAGATDPAARSAAVPVPPAAPRVLPSSAVQYRVLPAVAVPAASRRAGEQGTVWLRVLVGRDGLPREIRVHRSSGHERLDEQALAAMAAARFEPQIQQGEPIEWIVIAPLQYELE